MIWWRLYVALAVPVGSHDALVGMLRGFLGLPLARLITITQKFLEQLCRVGF